MERRCRFRLPCDQRRIYLGHATPHGYDQLRADRGRAAVAPRRLTGSPDTFGGYRARLVEGLRAKGIRDLAVLRAFAETPRHLFVPQALRHRAYEDAALPDQVFTIERVRALAESAQAALKAAAATNVSLLVGDGTLGWSAYAPYHADRKSVV